MWNRYSLFSLVSLVVILCVPVHDVHAAKVKLDAGSQNKAYFSSKLQQKYNRFIQKTPNRNDLITVVIESQNSDFDQNAVRLSGGKLRHKFGKRHEIKIPIKDLNKLQKNLNKSSRVRLPFPHKALSTISQGVDIMGALDMHTLGNQGAGVKIGIIDLQFSNYSNSINSGELPSTLSIVDYTGTGLGGGNHGTNVAEIVYDMAPAADLYLAKVASINDLEQAMLDMQAAGVNIINHSVAWFGAAFYDASGDICNITNQAESAGMLWVNAMGNSRNAHYLGTFSDADSNLQHEFKVGQNYNTINLTQGVASSLVLNWDDYPLSRIDYNLYLYDGIPGNGGAIVASSQNSQSGSGWYPYEAISYVPAFTGTHYIVVSKKSANTAQIPLTLFSLGPALGEKVNASSLTQPADCLSVLSVGAVDLNDTEESFSSEGPTTNGINKPEIVATDRTITSLTGSFAGTSGASPHAAGAAALLLSQNLSLTPQQIKNKLIATAQDVSSAGFDFRTGFGRISLDADQDLVNHDNDNCPVTANNDQLDTDLDLTGNSCDADDDNDGLTDLFEDSIGTNPLLVDTDNDGLDDLFEVSFDGDPSLYTIGADLNPLSNDTDNDGFLDAVDPLELTFNYMDGDLAPLGNPDGVINLADYVVARRILSGDVLPTEIELSHGDLYPQALPDGEFTTSDMLIIYQKLLQ